MRNGERVRKREVGGKDLRRRERKRNSDRQRKKSRERETNIKAEK